MSPSETAGLEHRVLALASNAEEYWTTQEIAAFVGRSRRQVYRILARHREFEASKPNARHRTSPKRPVRRRTFLLRGSVYRPMTQVNIRLTSGRPR
jgi:hypothetical protein